MTNKYHFGVSAEAVWTSHIIIGLFLIYFGYSVINKTQMPNYVPIIVIVLGALGGLYHAHLWYVERNEDDSTDTPDNN
jgi:hypothetical protein